MNKLGLVILSLSLFAISGTARAGHFGVFLGPSIFSGGATNSTYMTWGLDAAFSAIPTVELGGFYNNTLVTNATITTIGAELNFYPVIAKSFYFGGKLGNAAQGGSNQLAYAPVAGMNFNSSSNSTLGVEAQYFMYSTSTWTNFSLLGNVKFWF